jgi:hypothetical protein
MNNQLSLEILNDTSESTAVEPACTPVGASQQEFVAFIAVMIVLDGALIFGLIEKAAAIVAQVAVRFGG